MKTLAAAKHVNEIEQRLRTLTPTDTARWGRMRVGGMVCHLRDAYEYALGEREAGMSPPPPLPRPIFKLLALRVPLRWPPGVPTLPEVDQECGGTPPADFHADVDLLCRRMHQLAGWRGPWRPHPIFAAMAPWDWMRWGYLHADHHLRQFGR